MFELNNSTYNLVKKLVHYVQEMLPALANTHCLFLELTS